MIEWIRVDEEMPELLIEVLIAFVYPDGYPVCEKYGVTLGMYDGCKWTNDCAAEGYEHDWSCEWGSSLDVGGRQKGTLRITHWAELNPPEITAASEPSSPCSG